MIIKPVEFEKIYTLCGVITYRLPVKGDLHISKKRLNLRREMVKKGV